MADIILREAVSSDLPGILALYSYLGSELAEDPAKSSAVWEKIMDAEGYHIIVAESEGRILSTCACTVISNLTHGARPYAFVENVVTHPDARRKGYATMCLDMASEIARANDCYKIMLMTGSKREATLNFYRKAGYNSDDKTAFVRWLT